MSGDKEPARRQFAELWEEIGAVGDPLCRCRLAHHMADLQDDPVEELTCSGIARLADRLGSAG